MTLLDDGRLNAFRHREWAIPFHNTLGIEVVEAGDHTFTAQVRNREELRGTRGAHGGVVASMLDSACGYLAAIAALRSMEGEFSPEEARRRVDRIATIDIHIDFVRPPRAALFVARSSVVHIGKSVIRTRGQVESEDQQLVALGIANYAY